MPPQPQNNPGTVKPRRLLRWWHVLLVLIVAVAIGAVVWATTSVESGLQKAKEGTVVDLATGKPIAGASVVVRWYHADTDRWPIGHGGRGGHACVFREVATTDANGHYLIPSTVGKFEVRREVSVEKDTAYFWDLGAYAPGYEFAWPQNMYQTGGEHPAAHGAGEVEQLDPVKLTARAAGSGNMSLERYECPAAEGSAPPFLAQVYHEAYGLACEHTGMVWPRKVADFREHLQGAMPPLPSTLATELDGIRQHYRFNDPPSPEDDARICAILKASNEEQQP